MQSASTEGNALILTRVSQWPQAEKIAQFTEALEQRLGISVKGECGD